MNAKDKKKNIARALVELADLAAAKDIDAAWTGLTAGLRGIDMTPRSLFESDLLWPEQRAMIAELAHDAEAEL